LKVEWTKEESGSVKEGNDVGPSDVLGAVGSGGRVNKVAVAVIDGAGSVDSVGVPFRPPSRVPRNHCQKDGEQRIEHSSVQ